MRTSRIPLLLALTLAIPACGPRQAAVVPRATIHVRVAPVSIERLSPPIQATGTLGPKEEVPLSFKIGGVVAKVPVDEGQVVRRGQTLATLDLDEVDAAVTRARSAAEKADRDLARARRLYADSVATLEQTQDAETGHDVAAAELRTALFNRQHSIIVAPGAGVILRRNAEPGQIVQAGVPVLVLGSQARGSVVRAGLADRDAVRIRRGDGATVRFEALPGREFQGRVTEIAAAADPGTGTFGIEVAIRASTHLASGLVGSLEVRPSAEGTVALVPVESLLEADGAAATIFTLAPDGRRAERRSVGVAFIDGNRAAVVSGLEGVREVITEGAARLRDGESVIVDR